MAYGPAHFWAEFSFQKVKAARHVIEPNPGFLSQLRRFEEELKSKFLEEP